MSDMRESEEQRAMSDALAESIRRWVETQDTRAMIEARDADLTCRFDETRQGERMVRQ